jgi:hypothetical protein
MASSGASENEASRAAVNPPVVSSDSDWQAAILKKGKVTTAEYQAAFEEFRKCDAAGSARIVNVEFDPATGAISYALNADELELPGSQLNRCYTTYFDQVEKLWQLTDPVFLAWNEREATRVFDEVMRPCLEANHISVPSPAPLPGTSLYDELSLAYLDLVNAGECDDQAGAES